MGFISESSPRNIITPSSGNEERRNKFKRMAGTILNTLASGGGRGLLPETQTTTKGQAITMNREDFVPSKPTRMTKEEYDKMPRRPRRKFELPPGSEGIIDKFDFDPRDPRSKGHRDRSEARIDQQIKDTAEGKGNYKMTKEEAMGQYDEAMRGYDSPPPRRATRSEMRERRRNPLGMGQVA